MRVALYARVSTGKQAKKDLSIPDQIHQMKQWCKLNGNDVVEIYIEPGKTATSARRRKVFQKMMADACVSPAPFDAIIIHSFSRFFRNLIEMALIQRTLKEYDTRLISLTQQTTDDPTGDMMRHLISMFDEYSSGENSKHTLRAMLENARQGNFNGARVPYGYRLVELSLSGNKGKKKRLEICPEEAEIVRRVYDLYIVRNQGLKGVASTLNVQQILRRGKPWSTSTISEMLTHRIYVGEYFFNCTCTKTGKMKPQDEWIKIFIEPIVTEETFALAQARRHERSPKITHPRLVSSPRLLTGILRCGVCGSSMTTATGKGNRYHYYKCTSRINQHTDRCTSKALPMDKIDVIILETLANKVFTPERVSLMLAELKQRIQKSGGSCDLQQLSAQLEIINTKKSRLYEAIENGLISLDEALKERFENLKRENDQISAKIRHSQQTSSATLNGINSNEVKSFCGLMKKRLLDTSSGFCKDYLKLLVKEIQVKKEEMIIRGNLGTLLGAVKFSSNNGTEHLLNSTQFRNDWLPNL